jgi:3-methyladenine DNA glycosylase AlkD
MTADEFVRRLDELPAPVPMGRIFGLAKACIDMAPPEIERLLESSRHEVRVGAVSVMDWQARRRSTTEERRRELFDLYVRRHDLIDTWDLVDRSAIWVVGEYLVDRPRDVIYELARSVEPMRRRTAILSTWAFIRRGDLDDMYRIAELLVGDENELVQKAIGWMLREAGKRDEARLLAYLDAHRAVMPRVTVRYAIEKLEPAVRERYLERPRRP